MKKKRKRRTQKKTTVDITQCKKCLYRPADRPENNIFNCFYIIYMGHRRPCEPSPNCTVFKRYNRKARSELIKRVKAQNGFGGI